MKSVLMLGDAGALPYIKNDVPKNAFNFCCSCTLPKHEKETNLTPLKKRTIQKRNSSIPSNKSVSRASGQSARPDTPWKWSHDVIALYSNTDAMKKGEQADRSETFSDNKRGRSATTFGAGTQSALSKSQLSIELEDQELHEQVIDKYNHIFD